MAGIFIAAVDNFTFEGEVSPIVIVAMLLGATGMYGIIWSGNGWVATAVTWVCVPLPHLLKRLLGLPNTFLP